MHRVLLATTCIGLVYCPLSSGEGQTGGAIERPAVAAGTEGVNPATTVYIDPETGELLEQPPAGAVPLVTPSVPPAELEQVESPVPGGGIMVDVRGRFQTPLEIRAGSDGKPVIRHGDASSAPRK